MNKWIAATVWFFLVLWAALFTIAFANDVWRMVTR